MKKLYCTSLKALKYICFTSSENRFNRFSYTNICFKYRVNDRIYKDNHHSLYTCACESKLIVPVVVIKDIEMPLLLEPAFLIIPKLDLIRQMYYLTTSFKDQVCHFQPLKLINSPMHCDSFQLQNMVFLLYLSLCMLFKWECMIVQLAKIMTENIGTKYYLNATCPKFDLLSKLYNLIILSYSRSTIIISK